MWRHLESNQNSIYLFDAILIGNVGVPGEYNHVYTKPGGDTFSLGQIPPKGVVRLSLVKVIVHLHGRKFW